MGGADAVTTLNGSEYRVKAQHPRRPGPLRITAKDGALIAVSGDRCDRVSAEHLASMIANGYVERVTLVAREPTQIAPTAQEGGD
jgi:hypothetical protein